MINFLEDMAEALAILGLLLIFSLNIILWSVPEADDVFIEYQSTYGERP